jgi:hypothetical protein
MPYPLVKFHNNYGFHFLIIFLIASNIFLTYFCLTNLLICSAPFSSLHLSFPYSSYILLSVFPTLENMRTIFRTKHKLRSSLMKTMPERDQQQTARCVYSIPCECGRSHIGETRRPLAVQLRQHSNNLKDGILEKIKISPS